MSKYIIFFVILFKRKDKNMSFTQIQTYYNKGFYPATAQQVS